MTVNALFLPKHFSLLCTICQDVSMVGLPLYYSMNGLYLILFTVMLISKSIDSQAESSLSQILLKKNINIQFSSANGFIV